MNRQTLLASIQRHLRDPRVESGSVRSLSEIVSLVAGEIRTEPISQAKESPVIPIGIIAAFVDGVVTEQEALAILEAVKVDNSVIAELIAAVLAKEESRQVGPPISDSLALRLMDLALPNALVSPVVETRNVHVSIHDAEPSSRSAVTVRTMLYWGVGIAAATAAVWLAFIFWIPKTTTSPIQNDIVVMPPKSIEEVPSPEVAPQPKDEFNPDTKRIEVVESPSVQPIEAIRPVDPQPERTPDMRNDNRISPESIAVTPEAKKTPQPAETMTPLHELVWLRLTGLVAVERVQPETPDYSEGEVWTAIAESSRSSLEANEGKAFRLVTLPSSRAEASIQQGGRLVLAPDSLVQLRRDSDLANDGSKASCTLDIEYGFVSLANVSQGTVVDLQSRGARVARLRWETEATIVVGYAPQGIAIQIHAGTLSIDNESYQDRSLLFAMNKKPQPIGAAKRIPTWVDRPVDTLPISKVILAQLAESPDVLADITRRTRLLSAIPNKNQSDVRTLATLAMWQTALTGPNIARLLNSAEPEIRNAALMRLVETPMWEPRYSPLWTGIERLLQQPQLTLQIQQICEQLRRGVGIEPIQTELLLSGLEGATVGQRALCDYLLRTSQRGGPRFDPTWTGQIQMRAIAQWRRVAKM